MENHSKMKKHIKMLYESPHSETIKINMNCVLCDSPGGGTDPIIGGGDAAPAPFEMLMPSDVFSPTGMFSPLNGDL